ncbi:MAG TPA: poly-gamma-glutamate hydrolase family protein [Acidimicrobiales bacterium]|nr:poly-gamma-glutamate hydrolase family protein [Acidimicrobiales bacterium]
MSRLAQLLLEPGVEEELALGSSVGFLAIHGGSLERGTDTIARAAAARAGASLYAVTQPPRLRWHLPSHEFDPEASPALATFLDRVELIVAVHGYGRPGRWTDLLLGGGNRALADDLGRRLAPALPGYRLVTELAEIPGRLRGVDPRNPVNRARLGGVQLELPPRVRGLGPLWAHWEGPGLAPPTAALVEALGQAALAWAG